MSCTCPVLCLKLTSEALQEKCKLCQALTDCDRTGVTGLNSDRIIMSKFAQKLEVFSLMKA